MISAAPHPPTSATNSTSALRSESTTLVEPPDADDWLDLSSEPLPVGDAAAWVVRPDCGGVVLFSGTARDHAPGRPDVEHLEYEAYDAYVAPIFAEIAARARSRAREAGSWLGRVVIWHRTGLVELAESAVVVAVSAPHRPEAFEAARFCIDTVKATAPIWKLEVWADGASWGSCDGT